MFGEIFLFEIKYRLTRPDTYLYFFGFLLVTTLAFATGSVPANDSNFVNAPLVVSKFFTIFSLFMMVVSASIMGAPLYRDLEYSTHEYYLSYPITKNDYFWGRFLGSFFFVLLVASTLIWGAIMGIFIGPKLGWLSADRVAPFNFFVFLKPFLLFLLPNLLLTSSIFFGLVAYTRNNKVIYSGAVILYLGYMISIFIIQNTNNRSLAYYIDAFGFTPLNLLQRENSPEAFNHLQIPVSGMMLVNRLIWTGMGLLVIILTWSRFSLVKFFGGRADKNKRKKNAAQEVAGLRKIPSVTTDFTGNYNRKTLLALTKIEWVSIVRDNYFRLIIGVGIFFLAFIFWMGGRQFGVQDLPRTVLLMGIYTNNFVLFVFLILMFYTGEVIHRERASRFALINDALPPPTWVLYSSKLLALFLLVLLLAFIPVITGICVQLSKGFVLLNLKAYLIYYFFISLPLYLEIVMFCFVVHVLINNKFAGHGIALAIWILLFLGWTTGRFNYRLLLYSYTPDIWVTDMDGFGPSAAPQFWFHAYWLFAGGLLVVSGALFYYRGLPTGFAERIRLAKHRFAGKTRTIAFTLLIGFLFLGAWNYYNISYINSWLTSGEMDQRTALFEKQLKKYEHLPLPGITRLKIFMDIYPEERKIITKSFVTIINNGTLPVKELLLDGDNLSDYSLKMNNVPIAYSNPLIYPWPKFTFFKKAMDTSAYRLYTFEKVMQHGDTAIIEVNSILISTGFTNNFSNLAVQGNGTIFRDYLPGLGYDSNEELRSNPKRKEYSLPPKEPTELPVPGDSTGVREMLFTGLSSIVDFEATVSTEAGQTAITAGVLDSSWKKDNRTYFHYHLNNPSSYADFPVFSAKYAVRDMNVKLTNGTSVNAAIYYHPSHTANINRFMKAYKDGLTYFSQAYGNYPFQQFRMMEGPAFLRGYELATGTADGEDNKWNAGLTKSNQFDFCYFYAAVSLGQQWWSFQVAPNHTQGAQAIADGLSKYGALMLCEKSFGKDNLHYFLKSESDWYLHAHQWWSERETPLISAKMRETWDGKAAVVYYGLQDLIGEDSMNAALREFHDEFAFRNKPPYAGSTDLLNILSKHVPDSLKYYLADSWNKITLYDNKAVKVIATATGKTNEYKVHLELSAGKSYVENGKEVMAAMNDYTDIGIFGEPGIDKEGRTATNPLYLKKYKLSAGNHSFDIIVTGRPVTAGIDPYNKLIDKNLEDNVIKF
ncbi:MAG: hypothetical protein ABIR15_16325 [Chitinophagaceae bacterium]